MTDVSGLYHQTRSQVADSSGWALPTISDHDETSNAQLDRPTFPALSLRKRKRKESTHPELGDPRKASCLQETAKKRIALGFPHHVNECV